MKSLQGSVRIHQQQLRHPFGTSRGIDATIPTVILETGDAALGEGSPVRYKGQSAPGVAAHIESLLAQVDGGDPIGEQLARVQASPLCSAARAAVDIAIHDHHARRAGASLHAFLGLRPPLDRTTSLTIGLDDPSRMEAKAREAAHWPILKVKLGRGPDADSRALRLVRTAAPSARLTVDANAGWDVPTSLAMFPVLAECGVELLEQPTPIGQLDALAEVNRLSPIPVYADEDAQGPACLDALRGRVRGINIKLMKCGGIAPALAMIDFARREGWGVLLGCMVETGIGIAAASHLAGEADWLDLDGALLSSNDPTDLPSRAAQPWQVPCLDAPGLGVRPSGAQ